MNNVTRRAKISEYIAVEEWASVDSLAKRFFVSVETVRRDLAALEIQGLVVRRYGGAFSMLSTDVGTPFNVRKNENASEKRAIAEKAARFVQEGMAIGLDASTTSWYLAKQIPDMDLTVVTNGIEVARALRGKYRIKVISPGGEYVHKYECVVGSLTESGFKNYSLDAAFVASHGLDKETGAWDSNEANALTKRAMLSVARKRILMADPGKFWRKNLVNLADWNMFDHLVLACPLDGDDMKTLETLGPHII